MSNTPYPPVAKQDVNPAQPLTQLWEQVHNNTLILTYVPNADEMSYLEALAWSEEMDHKAAALLEQDAKTQLHMEEAAQLVNDALDAISWPDGFISSFIGKN